jgi:NAD(P)-dependent dehydrogenase (short-subunit alcohol dehydrogenase family)
MVGIVAAIDQQFAGRRVLVTGGSMGIGLAVARALADRGAQLVLAARGVEALERASAELPGAGHESIVLDVADDGAWRRALATLGAGPLHGLVTAAGILGPVGALAELEPEQLTHSVAVNLIGTMLALHHTLPKLEQHDGRAVTLSAAGAPVRCPGTTRTPRRRQRLCG